MSEAPGFHYKAEEKHCNKACLFYLGWRAGYPAKTFFCDPRNGSSCTVTNTTGIAYV
jgi:hypothetical protein